MNTETPPTSGTAARPPDETPANTAVGNAVVSGHVAPAPEPRAAPPVAASASASPPTESAVAGAVASGRSSAGAWWMGLATLVALVALAVVMLLWQRLERVQQEMARRSTDMAEQVAGASALASTTDASVQALQARLVVAEVRLSEVSLQRTQLEELMLSVSRSRDDTLVLDIESGLRLAMQQAELTGSAQPLLSALSAADVRIARAAQPRLNPVQRAIGRDMDRIKASPGADLPALASQLDELARLVDELPLLNAPPQPLNNQSDKPQPAALLSATAELGAPMAPLTATVEAADPAQPVAAGTPSAAAPLAGGEPPAAEGASPQPASAPGAVSAKANANAKSKVVKSAAPAPSEPAVADAISPWATVQQWWSVWWGRTSTAVVRSAQDLVRVSRIHQPEAVLLAPDQSLFLREHIKLKLLNARLGLLSRQVPAARVDMQGVRAAVQKYFDPDAPATRQVVQSLTEALASTRNVAMPRPEESLTALAAAAKGR